MPQAVTAREGAWRVPACGPALEGYPWGQMDGRERVPGAPGCSCRGRAVRPPLPGYATFWPPSGGLGPRGLPVPYILYMGSGVPRAAPRRSYLVDSASSHMLVSKIKPCMSKYKHIIR